MRRLAPAILFMGAFLFLTNALAGAQTPAQAAQKFVQQDAALQVASKPPQAPSEEASQTKAQPADKPVILDENYQEQFTEDKLPFKEKEIIATRKIADVTTYKRAIKAIEGSSKLLAFIGITQERFSGSTFGIADYALISALVLLLIYGAAGIAVLKIVFFGTIKFLTFQKAKLLEKIFSNIKKPFEYFVYFFAFYVSFMRIAISLNVNTAYQNVFTIIFLTLITWAFIKIYDAFSERLEQIAKKKDSIKNVFPILSGCVRWLLIITAFLMILQRLGFDVKAFMVSLGIGGAALAFASKDTIANFFGSVSLIMDAPFKVGDRIQVNSKLDGVVESIGLRSTRIRNLDQTLSILPNSYLANEYIINVARWNRRKAAFKIALTYSASAEQIKNICDAVKKILLDDSAVFPDSVAVNFTEFGDSSLNINVVYFVIYTETDKYLATVERINFAVMEIVAQNKAEFAYPSQSVYIEKMQN